MLIIINWCKLESENCLVVRSEQKCWLAGEKKKKAKTFEKISRRRGAFGFPLVFVLLLILCVFFGEKPWNTRCLSRNERKFSFGVCALLE